MNNKTLHVVAMTLVWVGALNWGLVGLMDYNLVSALLSGMPAVEKLVYVLVGLAAVYAVVMHKKECMVCAGKK